MSTTKNKNLWELRRESNYIQMNFEKMIRFPKMKIRDEQEKTFYQETR